MNLAIVRKTGYKTKTLGGTLHGIGTSSIVLGLTSTVVLQFERIDLR